MHISIQTAVEGFVVNIYGQVPPLGSSPSPLATVQEMTHVFTSVTELTAFLSSLYPVLPPVAAPSAPTASLE